MADKYYLTFKTGQAELRAYKHLTHDQKTNIAPLVELTRGRKNHKNTYQRTNEEYNFSAIEAFIRDEIYKDQEFYIDVTKDDALSSERTKYLRDPSGGYAHWVEHAALIAHHKSGVSPVMQVTPVEGESWNSYEGSLRSQFDSLARSHRIIGYRAAAKKDNFFDADLIALQDRIQNFTAAGNIFRFYLDYDYIRPGTGDLHSVEASKILSVVHDLAPYVSPVLVATSFPTSVTDVGEEDAGEFNEEEVIFHEATSRLIHNKFSDLKFGDYGSINPTRNDGIIMANGWRPRIDYPFGGNRVFYYREKRKSEGKGKRKQYITTYSHHYRSVAHNVVNDNRFIKDKNSADFSSWGVKQIKAAANGDVASSSPSFWISVRMNIHIQQQLRRLGCYQTPNSVFD